MCVLEESRLVILVPKRRKYDENKETRVVVVSMTLVGVTSFS